MIDSSEKDGWKSSNAKTLAFSIYYILGHVSEVIRRDS